jgi:hypothetical protein
MPRRFIRSDSWEFGDAPAGPADVSETPKPRKRRLAATLVFATVFFSGASLAAVAGDKLAYVAGDTPASAPDATSVDASAPQADGTDVSAAPDSAAPAAVAPDTAAPDAATADTSAPDAVAPDGSAAQPDATASPDQSSGDVTNDAVRPVGPEAPASASPAVTSSGKPLSARAKKARAARVKKERLQWVLLPKVKKAPKPEIEGPAQAATVWLNSPLPDPTPPAMRLSPKFAANLKTAAHGAGVDWAVMLGVLRARGATGHFPADRGTLSKLAGRLSSHGPTKGDWATIVAYAGDNNFADEAAALARYDRAVGLSALVNGLESAKKTIATRLLADKMVHIYAGGQSDIVADKVDVRVLAMVAYLRESFGEVTVSSLISGHRLYARPGVISAHIPGHAVDISALGGVPIQGHQQPGGLTERAVRDILFAPAEIMPRQVISLLGLGGPSFPLADHYNHIHIGY